MQELYDILTSNGLSAKFKGKGIEILCPFHDDTTPSLHVFDNGFKCFACGASGSLQHLFIELGIEEAPRPDALKAISRKLMNSISTNLHCLKGIPNSKSYSGNYRNIKSQIYLANKVFFTDSESLCFPLYDLDSKYRGYVRNIYGGKYINNFISGYVPYNLNNLNSSAPIIVEGIYDALSVMNLGYTNVIATLGTGQIWNVVKILKQIKANNIHILFDSDDAGIYAAKKLSDMYRSSKIISISEPKEDPNSYKNLKELLETEYEVFT